MKISLPETYVASAETSVCRDQRIRREAELIAQAEVELEAGLGIEMETLDAWFDALDLDANAPLPLPKAPPRP